MRAAAGANGAGAQHGSTPIIRGWAAYYRSGVSSEVFSALDDYMWKLTYKWAKRHTPEQVRGGGSWTGTSAGSTRPGNNRWVFGDRDSGAYLPKFAWTKIVRHAMVTGTASRRSRPGPTTGPTVAANSTTDRSACSCSPSSSTGGRCPLCGTCCCTPTANHSTRASGNSGCAAPDGDQQAQYRRRERPGRINASSTPPAGPGPPDRQRQHCSLRPQRQQDLLEPDE